TAYDPRIDRDTRLAAVEAYQAQWGRYLGARDAEVEALREDIRTAPMSGETPDRTLPRDPDAYRGVPDDRLAGGPYGTRFEPRVIFRPSRTEPGWQDPNWQGPGRPSVGGETSAPRVRRERSPRYPSRAMRRGAEAVVTLALTIDENGRVAETELIDVEADAYASDFVRAAERAALRTRFHPRTIDGMAVEARGIRKRYRFELE
ncbi:MAG: energy transducer TonB, partial [Litorimonas sp.]